MNADLETSLTYSLIHQRRLKEAQSVITAALSEFPGDAEALWCDAQLAFFLNDPRAWIKMEARWGVKDTGDRPIPLERLWDGSSSITDKTLLLAGEGGLGDQIHFARYAFTLRRRNPGRLVASVNRRLIELFSSLPFDEIIPLDDRTNTVDQKKYDVGIPMLSAPHILDDFGPSISFPYLAPPPGIDSRCVDCDSQAFNIGLNWTSSKERRTLTLAEFQDLFNIPGVQVYALGERAVIEREISDLPIEDLASDICGTARAMQKLDLVVTVDSMAAHLSASLNCPTWVLLHAVPDFRWGLSGNRTHWYPSMRLFRKRTGEWSPLIAEIATAISNIAGLKNGRPDARTPIKKHPSKAGEFS